MAVQQILDLLERKANEFQGCDLLQADQIALTVQALACAIALAGFEKAQPVIMMQGPHCHPGFFCKFTDF